MKTTACRDGTLRNQPNKIEMTPQFTPSLREAGHLKRMHKQCVPGTPPFCTV